MNWFLPEVCLSFVLAACGSPTPIFFGHNSLSWVNVSGGDDVFLRTELALDDFALCKKVDLWSRLSNMMSYDCRLRGASRSLVETTQEMVEKTKSLA